MTVVGQLRRIHGTGAVSGPAPIATNCARQSRPPWGRRARFRTLDDAMRPSALKDQTRSRSVGEHAPLVICDPSFGCPDTAAAVHDDALYWEARLPAHFRAGTVKGDVLTVIWREPNAIGLTMMEAMKWRTDGVTVVRAGSLNAAMLGTGRATAFDFTGTGDSKPGSAQSLSNRMRRPARTTTAVMRLPSVS
jgi:hypothetical protein